MTKAKVVILLSALLTLNCKGPEAVQVDPYPYLGNPTGPANLIFQSSLDDPNSVANPMVGVTGNYIISSSPANDFSLGYNNGMGFNADAVGEFIRFPQTVGGHSNVNPSKGTVEFWYQPNYNSNNATKYTIFGTGDWHAPGSVHLGKHNPSNNNALFLIFFDSAGTFYHNNVIASNFSWSANEWVLVKMTWDFTVAVGEQNLHLYLNGVEAPITATGNGAVETGPKTMPPANPNSDIYIGSRDLQGNIIAGGIYDEIRIFDGPIANSNVF